jgi:hypothetical protein
MTERRKIAFGDVKMSKLEVKELVVGGDPINGTTGNQMADGVTFTIGTEAANAINVAMQVTSGGSDMAEIGVYQVYLSDASTGIGISGTAPATSVAVGTDGAVIVTQTAKLAWVLQTEADGDVDLTITDTTGATWYMVVVMPDGSLAVSGAITFAT